MRIADSKLGIEGATPGYFRAMGIQVVEGRDFEERDYEPDAPGVFIVSESLARRFWPGESAVGKRLVSGRSAPEDGRWRTVVGVIKDMRREGLDVRPILLAFEPYFSRGMDITIHASRDTETLLPSIRREILAIDDALPIASVVTASGLLSQRIGGRRFETQVAGVFAAIALLLSAAGVYALLAYQVELRRHEIGIRSAVGADRSSIIRMILAKGVGLALAGVIFGLLGAMAAARLIQSLLYETAAIDPASYAVAASVLLGVAAAAAWSPARRAASIDPIVALRRE